MSRETDGQLTAEHGDGELVRLFQAGDRGAFTQLARRWEADMLNLAYRLTGDLEDARDIRQAALLRAFLGLSRFQGDARFSTWLYRLTVNLCHDHNRARMRRRRLADSIRADAAAPDHASAHPDDTSARVGAALGALPAEEREAIVLRHYHGLSFADIAEVVQSPVTTVRSRFARGLCRLRDRLAPLEA